MFKTYHAILTLFLLTCGCGDKSGNFPTPQPEPAFASPQKITIENYNGDAMEPFLTRDGTHLFFNNLNEPAVNTNLHYAVRKDDTTFTYRGELSGANTDALEGVPTMDNRNTFYFISPRSYRTTLSTIYCGLFANGAVSGVRLVEGISRKEAGIVNFDVEVSADGERLYFVDGRFDAFGKLLEADLVVAARSPTDSIRFERLSDSKEILQHINTSALEYAAGISADEQTLCFTRVQEMMPDAEPKIFISTRKNIAEPFGVPHEIAIKGFVEGATFSPDSREIIYHKKENGRFVLYRAARK